MQISCLKNLRALVVPGGGSHKWIIIQVILMPTGVLPNGKLSLIIKGDVTGASDHATRQKSIMYDI